MSVSSRSPTTNGRLAWVRWAARSNSVGAGFPTTSSGCRSSAVARAATREPLPGNGPRTDGRVRSAFVATHSAPARTATHASASSGQPTRGPYPWTTASGLSSALSTTVSPTPVASVRNASVPTTSTFPPGGSRSASRAAAACGEVSTSSARAGTPSPVSSSATSSGRRAALFVAYTNGVARSRSRLTASTAPGTGSVPR